MYILDVYKLRSSLKIECDIVYALRELIFALNLSLSLL